MHSTIRVRFAPSPTGGLHLGGVRTILFNYLFAKKNGGQFILRIEDTDQTRYVAEAEQYIQDCLEWCGLLPDESPTVGGAYGPYRQSERKPMYRQYAEKLIAQGNAYFAFDTPEELDTMRQEYKTQENPSPTYGHETRMKMKNSLSLAEAEVQRLLSEGVPYVIRIKMPDEETVSLNDAIRGTVSFQTSQVDDKVLLKADGMPTYHLALVVDDYLMKISHAFRGEEWLSSAPVHVLLWKYLGWETEMPVWAHLPLIMGPDGAKLSKRHGNKYGFPIFAMNWNDEKKNEFTEGFREKGFLPQAFINLLALLGWNPGTEQEIFTLEELIGQFDLSRVHSAGAQFDFDKAKWYNHEWIKKLSATELLPDVSLLLEKAGILLPSEERMVQIIEMVKDRCTLLSDFEIQAGYFFKAPQTIDSDSLKPKWDEKKVLFFSELIRSFEVNNFWEKESLETVFKEIAAANTLKPGELMLPFRVMLVGGKFGPGVFDIAAFIGKEETIARIKHTLGLLNI